jgi:TRAP-type mannitol/chloroaromatic compound transport system permease large subunit
MIEGLVGFAAMFALMLLRVPIAISMGLVGLIGLGLMRSWPAAMSSAAGEFVDIGSYTLSVVPLFVLMGTFVTRAGMSRDLYQAAYAFIGHLRGDPLEPECGSSCNRRIAGRPTSFLKAAYTRFVPL